MKEILRQNIPNYSIEPNAISQGIYNMGAYAQKLIAMAMSLISIDKEQYSVKFRTADFLETMGLEVRKQGSETKTCIKAAVEECLNSHIGIKMPNGNWIGYSWFTKCGLLDANNSDLGWDTIEMNFNPELGTAIKAFMKGFTKIDIKNIVKLQSKYAIRYIKLAVSYAGFAGKDGNFPGQWYFEETFDEIRKLFKIENKKYKKTNEFKRNIIDKPLEELNAAEVGLQIEPVYIRQSRYLIGVRFNCRWAAPKRKAALPVNQNAQAEETLQEEALIAAYPEEFAKYKADYLEEKSKHPGIHTNYPEMLEQAAEGEAIRKIKEKHSEKKLKRKH